MRVLHQADSAALRIAASTWHHDLAPLPMSLLVFNTFGSYISFEEFKLLIFSPLWQYDMKLLAVDIPMATGPEQRLFLIGDEQDYKIGGGLISELRDPMVKAMAAEKDFEDLDQQEEEEDKVRELEVAERIRKKEKAEREQLELESLRKGGSS